MPLISDEMLKELAFQREITLVAIDAEISTPDHFPIVKIAAPTTGAAWLFTEYNPEAGTLYGLCDPGLGYPEIGLLCLSELEELAKSVRLVVDVIDTHIQLSEYASEARRVGRLIL
jgi:hypothetical protein